MARRVSGRAWKSNGVLLCSFYILAGCQNSKAHEKHYLTCDDIVQLGYIYMGSNTEGNN